ncbi:MAG: PQQ-binding-like beta-propeller repeat protein [Planctomycetota bacterium]|nr:PQQ-binding-like beta-propeller repeat protein [Planctomycetota bacterium]MDP7248958.1 PQQ-binding-like beta-propeller repeat protein [Planctomycetota bacterium]
MKLELVSILVPLIVTASAASAAEEWPAYRADAARSGQSSNKLTFPLKPVWEYEPAQAPRPAWPEPGTESNRLDFDYGPQPVIAGGLVIFGSTADDTVRALSLTTGKLVWRFTADGPVRFAPHVASGLVYVASDDGFLYCLDLTTGKERWQFQAAPGNDRIIGNGRMISRWPLRSGVLVDDGVAYITAGVWPSEGIFVYALDAQSGKIIWCNDSSGAQLMPGKHLGAWELSGISPQGYLAASGKILIVPTGRGTPHQFNRQSGKFLTANHSGMLDPRYGKLFSTRGYSSLTLSGGAWSMVVEEKGLFLSGGRAGYGSATFLLHGSPLPGKSAIREPPYPMTARHGRRAVITEKRCFTSPGLALILAGNALLKGDKGILEARDTITDEEVLRETFVQDEVRGLAVADGHLVAGTRLGKIVCYADSGKTGDGPAKKITDRISKPKQTSSTTGEDIVHRMIERKTTRGHALIIDPGDAGIAEALTRQTDLQIIILMMSKERVESERDRLLTTTGLYGSRIAIHHLEDLSRLPFGPYFANLVVVANRDKRTSAKELYRVLRPCGGVMCFVGNATLGALRWMLDGGTPREEISKWQGSDLVIRGKLPGAFDWDSRAVGKGKSSFPWKNLKSSEAIIDQRVKWPLELLWFGGMGPALMASRHWSPSTPVPANGRYFVVGQHHVVAVDAYNGTVLWKQDVHNATTRTSPRAAARGVKHISAPSTIKSLYANDQSVYLNLGGTFIQYDAQTGEQAALYSDSAIAPNITLAKPHSFELRVDEEHTGTITISKNDEGLKLVLQTKDPVVTWHDEWELFFDFRPIDRRFGTYGKETFQALVHTGDQDYYKRKRNLEVRYGAGTVRPQFAIVRKIIDSGIEVTLTLSWEEMKKLTGKRPLGLGFSATLNGSDATARLDGRKNLLHRAYLTGTKNAPALNQGWPNLSLGTVAEADNTAGARKGIRPLAELPKAASDWSLRPAEDQLKWRPDLGQRLHPLTGEPGRKVYRRSYGCRVTPIASESMLFFRSSSLGYWDVEDDAGLRNFGGIRPGCGGGLLPALGLFIASESSSGCACSYSFQTSLALVPAERRKNEDWALFYDEFPGEEVKQISLNLGAPGDRRDQQKQLWLGFPRPRVRPFDPHPVYGANLAMEVPVSARGTTGFTPHRQNADRIPVGNTGRPWIYASCYRGLKRIVFDLHPVMPWTSRATARPPELDGKLNDPCWQEVEPLLFTPESTPAYMRHDENNLYIAFRQEQAFDVEGNRIKWGETVHDDDADIWLGRSFELYFTNNIGYYDPRTPPRQAKICLHFGISASGARFDSLWQHEPGQKRDLTEDITWNKKWRAEVKLEGNVLSGEFAIPRELFTKAGIKTNAGLQMVLGKHLADFHGAYQNWAGFRNVALDDQTHQAAKYTVRLHFAEPDDVPIGERIFDIALQGKVVAEGVDIIREAGGRNQALVKEFKNISARRDLTLELHPKAKLMTSKTIPIVSGIEVFKQ